MFPGLWLDPAALIREDLNRLLDVLQHGLDSPEHADFVARLRRECRTPELMRFAANCSLINFCVKSVQHKD